MALLTGNDISWWGYDISPKCVIMGVFIVVYGSWFSEAKLWFIVHKFHEWYLFTGCPLPQQPGKFSKVSS